MSEDNRTEWQKRMGVGEKRRGPRAIRQTTETTPTGCIKERIEYDTGRIDNYYTLPTREIHTTMGES